MTTFSKAIATMAGLSAPLDRVILHKCLMLDGSKLTMASIIDFINGQDVELNIADAAKLFVHYNDIQTHIINTSGYNICIELLRSMVLGTTGKMGFDYNVLSKMDEENIRGCFHTANLCENPLERAARIYATIVEYNAVENHSEAIGYLMMLYSLKRDGYAPYIPTDSNVEDMLNIRKVISFPAKVDKMLNILRMFYPEVQEHYHELHGVNKCYKEGD